MAKTVASSTTQNGVSYSSCRRCQYGKKPSSAQPGRKSGWRLQRHAARPKKATSLASRVTRRSTPNRKAGRYAATTPGKRTLAVRMPLVDGVAAHERVKGLIDDRQHVRAFGGDGEHGDPGEPQ